MTKFKHRILIILIIIGNLFISCTKEAKAEEELIVPTVALTKENTRANFLKNNTFDENKSKFDNLVTKDKYILWNNKIEQLLDQKLPNAHLVILKQLQIELKNLAIDKPNRIPELAIKLARITPKQDFIMMFAELEDYHYNGKFIDTAKVPNEIINSFKITITNRNQDTKHNIKTSRRKKCNCSWTCDSTVGGYTTNCEETTSGCGFMWMFPCTGRVFSEEILIKKDTIRALEDDTLLRHYPVILK